MKTTFLLAGLLSISALSFAQTNTFEKIDTVDLGQNYYGSDSIVFNNGNFESEIDVMGFPSDLINTGDQIRFVRINLEHSSLDELEIWVECPNGSKAVLINSFDGQGFQEIPGGYNDALPGSGVFLGDPNLDGITGNRGIGWEYSFSSYFNTFDEIEVEKNNGNFIPATQMGNNGNSMNPNSVYKPYSSFDDLIGCPVEGTWTISIADYVDFENGTFFGWGFDLDGFLSSPVINATEQEFLIFPNPASNIIHVQANELNNQEYSVINSSGQTVISGQLTTITSDIDISSLDTGFYFVKIGAQSQRFVKQ